MNQPESGKPATPLQGYRVTQVVSFLLLTGIVIVLGVIFYYVMARFVVPLFLAALLVVIFRPLHDWVLGKVNGSHPIGSLLTTLIILLLVLVPVSVLVLIAATEGSVVLKQVNAPKIVDDLAGVRKKLKLDMPNAREIRTIETRLTELQSSVVIDDQDMERHSAMLFEIMSDAYSVAQANDLDWPVSAIEEDEAEPARNMQGYWQKFGNDLSIAKGLQEEIARLMRKQFSEVEDSARTSEDRHQKIHDYIKNLGEASGNFLNFKFAMMGGRTRTTIIEATNPTSDELRNYTSQLVSFMREKLFALGGSITSFLANTAFSAVIMIIGLYFFLLDGPAMLKGLHALSPIDDQYEEELVLEFARVSRAVVLATLLSAVAQGLLAGIGFWVCGLDSIFLLTLLSGVLAMVPFVGAAAVWIPCALYLFFVDNNPVMAIGLAVYGVLVISMADNLIKPWILHGQSNLHPLLALLSVIGGVAVLGPIGILIGPMIVVFLQTLLKILQREMLVMEHSAGQAKTDPAG